MLVGLLFAVVVGGCGGTGSELKLDAVEAGLSKDLPSYFSVNSMICVRKDEDEAECAAEYTSDGDPYQSVALVRCDHGSCIWEWKGRDDRGGGFDLEEGDES